MRLAVLDIGSNTVHLAVVDGRADGVFRHVGREREVLRLADSVVPGGDLPADVERRLTETAIRMRAAADRHGAEALVALATSAVREARNSAEVLGRLRQATGVPVQVLPGAEEARLTYVAARRWAAQSVRRLLVLDIGGGSLEIAGGETGQPEFTESLPLGATRLTRRFVRSDPPREDELVALREHVLRLLAPLAERVRAGSWDVVCATSKTFRTLGMAADALPNMPVDAYDLGFAGVDGRTARRLDRTTARLLAGRLATTTLVERVALPGLDELRARNLVAGAQVAALAMQAFGLGELVLAPWALREGVIIEELARRAPVADADPTGDPRRRAVLDFAHRHAWDAAHAETVTGLALALFDQTAALHGLGPAERELLEYAGILHDVGYAVSQSAHHKHSLYLIRNADLDGFTQRELLVMANVARYHRRALPTERHADYTDLSEDDRRLVRRLAALLRVADGLDLDHLQVVTGLRVRGLETAPFPAGAHLVPGSADWSTMPSGRAVPDEGDEGAPLRLELRARDIPDLSLWAAARNSDLFEAEFGRPLRPEAVTVH